MIYHVYWRGVPHTSTRIGPYHGKEWRDKYGEGNSWTPSAVLAKWIKESKDDTFVFVIASTGERGAFANWIKKEDLEKEYVFESKGITNPTHPGNRGNITVHIIKSPGHYSLEGREEASNWTDNICMQIMNGEF